MNEYAYTAALDAASERVRAVEIGRTVLGRPINMLIIGYPAPRPTVQAISNHAAALLNCNVHGNEPSSREGCLIMARELAFSDDPRTLDILRDMTVLIVPAINGDGRAANTRGNSTGQDLNRDHSLLRQPETFALSAMVRDYTPEVAYDGHEFGNDQAGELPTLMPRRLNVAESIFSESTSLIENWLYGNGSEDGWWYCPYGCAGRRRRGPEPGDDPAQHDGPQEHGQHAARGPQRRRSDAPERGIPANNRRRKTYSATWAPTRISDPCSRSTATLTRTPCSAPRSRTSPRTPTSCTAPRAPASAAPREPSRANCWPAAPRTRRTSRPASTTARTRT